MVWNVTTDCWALLLIELGGCMDRTSIPLLYWFITTVAPNHDKMAALYFGLILVQSGEVETPSHPMTSSHSVVPVKQNEISCTNMWVGLLYPNQNFLSTKWWLILFLFSFQVSFMVDTVIWLFCVSYIYMIYIRKFVILNKSLLNAPQTQEHPYRSLTFSHFLTVAAILCIFYLENMHFYKNKTMEHFIHIQHIYFLVHICSQSVM